MACMILDFSYFFDPQKIKLPEMESAIVQIVQNASMTGKQVRVVGSGHSRNALACSRDLIVSLERFKGVVNLNRQSQQASISWHAPVRTRQEVLSEN